MESSAGQGRGAGPALGRGCLAGRGGAARRTARPPAAAVIPIVPTDAPGRTEAQEGWSDGANAACLPHGGGQRGRGEDTERYPDKSPNTRARTAPAAVRAAGEIERHSVESPNTRVRTAVARAGGCGGMTTGQLSSASQQGTVAGAILNKTTAPAAAGQGSDGYSQVVRRNQVTVGRGGHEGRTAGQSLVPASRSGPPIVANLNGAFANVAADDAAANQDGRPAASAEGNTCGPTIQHGTRLVRASTAFMHDK